MTSGPRIKVVGAGYAGGRALDRMIGSGMTGVEFIVVDTNARDLQRALAPRRFQFGTQFTKGQGAGGNSEAVREAALEDRERLAELVAGADVVFVTAGMGGGTGTGAAPVIAQLAYEAGALTLGVVTRPFWFEGKKRRRQAAEGVEALKGVVDTLITIPSQRLISMANKRISMKEAFNLADEGLLQAIKGVSDLIKIEGVVDFEGIVNVDFDDVRTALENKGVALMGVGSGSGKNKTVDAARRAISSPLLHDVSISGATSVLMNITGNCKLTLFEINEASALLQEKCDEEANLTWGWAIDDTMEDESLVTVIATGFKQVRHETRPSRGWPPITAMVAAGGSPHHGRGGAWPDSESPGMRSDRYNDIRCQELLAGLREDLEEPPPPGRYTNSPKTPR